MSNRIKDNTVGPWAKDKLESLERGLDYYTTRLKKTDYWQKIYIDAFAGPGLSEVRSKPKDPEERLPDLFAGEIEKDPVEQEVEYLRGSPRVALELKNPFDRYIFIEKDPKRIAELLAMKAEYDGRRYIEVRPGDANAVLQELLRRGIRKRSHRAYAFLDPFGLQMPWETIEALAATEAVEVMINFPMGMAIRRMMPKSGDVPPDWHISLTTFFGTDEWRKYAYEEVTDLAGPRTRKFADSETRLMEWYRERLRMAFGYVSEAQLITNTRGGRLYYLIWAGPHPAGLTGANYILTMKKRAPARKA
jgi:three-Cys-motif partner protein